MARLSEQIISIPIPTLKLLQKQNIITVLDFLKKDPEKLSTLCSIPFKEIVDLRQQLISSHSAVSKRGLEAYQELVSNSALVPTGIKSLDVLLKGGLLTGNVFEICGSSGDGKTQLCLTITANITNHLKQVVHYIDTKGDFCAKRLSEILLSQELSSEECKAAMNRIQVTKVNDIYQLITFVEHMKQLLSVPNENVCRLIIIDSVPAMYFPFLGDNNNEGLSLLNHLMSIIKSLTTEYHVIFMVVNLATSYVEAEGDQNRTPITEVRPSLGKYWLHTIGTRLLIQKINNTSDERCIKILKSTYLLVGVSCNVRLQQSGFQ